MSVERADVGGDAGRRGRTIFALSTGIGIAAVAVVRISGPQTSRVLEEMTGKLPEPRKAALVTLRGSPMGAILDQPLVLWFPAPRSFTGEDLAELHLHGGRAVVAGVLNALSAMPGLRAAEPGEFTRRAFRNGKLDLTEVEGLADLLQAETQAQRRQALAALDGGLRRKAEAWRETILRAAAFLEAELDFSDEDDVPSDVGRRALNGLPEVVRDIRAVSAGAARGERIRDGFTVVLAGPPNAGKSSLMNALARREVAIVSAAAGTTRDLIEVHLDLDGYPVVLVDTAGLRESASLVEQEGVRRALARAEGADLVLWLSPADAPEPPPPALGSATVLTIRSKVDLLEDVPSETMLVSAHKAEGMKELLSFLAEEAGARLGGETVLATRARQRALLEACAAALDRALASPAHAPLELVAEEVRLALARLGELTGRVDVEQLLDVIFGEFCIGK